MPRTWLDTRYVIPALPRMGDPGSASLDSGLRRKDDCGEGLSHNLADVEEFTKHYAASSKLGLESLCMKANTSGPARHTLLGILREEAQGRGLIPSDTRLSADEDFSLGT